MLNFLVPRFLKQLDKHLLLNRPLLWISKLHYVLYFTLILWALTGLVAFLIPINLTDLVDTGLYYTFFTIIAIVLLCVWIYRNAIFNIERSYGNRSVFDEYKIFFIYFFSVLLFFSFSYPFAYVYSSRVAHAVSDEELTYDLNTLNLADPFFARNYYDYAEKPGKVDTINGYPNYTYVYDVNAYHALGKFTPYQIASDSVSLPGLMTPAKLNRRFNEIRNNDAACLQAISGYIAVMKKYRINFNYYPATILSRYRDLCKEPVTNSTFNNNYFYDYSGQDFFYKMESIIRNLVEAKFEKLFIFKDEFNIPMFYFIFYITVFFMMFRNVHWKQFLITIIILVVLPILLFIFGQFFSLYRGERFFQDCVLLIYLYCLGTTIYFALAGKKFSGLISICMQLTNLLTPVIFLLTVEILRDQFGVFDPYDQYYGGDYDAYERMMIDYYRDLYSWWIWASTIFGIVFYVAAFMPFMKEQFVKMKALPGNR